MSQNKTRSGKRSVSAKVDGYPKQANMNMKVQKNRVARVHTQTYNVQSPFKAHKTRLYTSTVEHMYKSNQKVLKQPEYLIEQNFHLKTQVKDLHNKLYLTRFKIQSQHKKNVVYAKKLNRQFQKQLYWPNQKHNDYLITGIKHQYEQLKLKYDDKCQQIAQINKTISATQVKELSAYCQALQTQNNILIENISYLKKNSRSRPRGSRNDEFNTNKTDYQDSGLQAFLQQQRARMQHYKNIAANLEEKLLKSTFTERQLQKKVKFLEKLIIEKQNDVHHAHKNIKNIDKQKNKLGNQIKILEHKIYETQNKCKNDLKQFKQTNDKQAKIQKGMFQKMIKQRNTTIAKLEKEIGYLSTLLSYWKPLDEIQRHDPIENASQKQKTTSSHNNSTGHNYAYNRQLQNRSRTPVNSMFIDDNKSQQIGKYAGKSLQNQDFLLNKDFNLQSINLQDDQGTQNREPRRSSKKWNKESQKCRRVNFSEIQYLGELIKYKVIASKKSLNQIKQYFSYKGPKETGHKNDQQLITMKQIKEILMSVPFSLSVQQAFLLSRYIIEDQGAEFVYCHEGNQLERSIVKSIVKTVVGDYSVPNQQKSSQKWRSIKKVYSHNMQLALKSICPKGVITKDKFLELVDSLGIQMDEQTKNYLIGKLVSSQKSLQDLKYDSLFQNDQKIH